MLNPEEEWSKLVCTPRPLNKKGLKKTQPSIKSIKLMKENLDFAVLPTNRFCGVCGATEPEHPLPDFYCPLCMVWVC
jgi:hypothetical protein